MITLESSLQERRMWKKVFNTEKYKKNLSKIIYTENDMRQKNNLQ